MKSSEVCIKTSSPPASLPLQGNINNRTTVKWAISEPLKVVNAPQNEGKVHIRKSIALTSNGVKKH